uniref:Major facilitator superfamily (MFS) profile domain-containing protein n=1 Tax=Euplotes crassus TaxID=5936 RepID=A0A7S3KMD2_EUPCR|mmetsp:Transcript_35227/g.34892  ORF Transcript_35227/g.34892 Transcript_35227/m.34892 type:complete len:326 (+) Transcript_35227:441-1418(+)
MMMGPLLGSALYAIGGFQLPFYVTGGALFLLTFFAFATLPSKENFAPDMRWSPNSGIVKNELTYLECLKNLRVVMISSIVVLSLLQLTFREPVLQFRLIDLGINPSYAGLIFALDLVGYIGVSVVFSRIPKEKKNLNFLVYLSMLIAVVGLFFVGTIHVLGVPDSLIPLIIGIIINGTAGALCINNSVAAMINILNIDYHRRGELVNNIASGIFAACFSMGEMLGPICGSVLTSITGGFTHGITVVNIAVVIMTVLTTYHLAGDVLFCLDKQEYGKFGRVPGKDKMAYIKNVPGEGDYHKLEDEEELLEFEVKGVDGEKEGEQKK